MSASVQQVSTVRKTTRRAPVKRPGVHTPSIEGGVTPTPGGLDIEGMSKTELKALLDRAALALMEKSKPDSQDRDLGLFATALHEHAGDILAGNVPGVLVFRQLLGTAAVWEPISRFLERTGYAALKPAQKSVVFGFLCELVARHAVSVSRPRGRQTTAAPLSAKLLVNCTSNLAGLFEQEFPGYLRAGFAGIVAKRLCAEEGVLS